MKVTWLPDAEPRPRHVAVGEFDGVHLGHREVIDGADTVLTFEPHPRVVVAPDAAPKLLTSLDVKTDLIAGLGVRELVVIPFDRSFAAQGPQEFIDSVLVEQLRAERVSVGENFRFGHKAKGDADLLRRQDAFEARVLPLVEVDGEIVSSTHIRGLVVAGDLEKANRFLGSPFQLRGAVCEPKPVQTAGPPILVGGYGDRMLRVVAEHADIWNIPGPPHGRVEHLVERSAVLDRHCAAVGRDPASLSRSTQMIVSHDDPAATRTALVALAGAGFDHFVLAPLPPYRDKVARWLADEIVVPVREELGR